MPFLSPCQHNLALRSSFPACSRTISSAPHLVHGQAVLPAHDDVKQLLRQRRRPGAQLRVPVLCALRLLQRVVQVARQLGQRALHRAACGGGIHAQPAAGTPGALECITALLLPRLSCEPAHPGRLCCALRTAATPTHATTPVVPQQAQKVVHARPQVVVVGPAVKTVLHEHAV